ncbi:hypothetical protein P6144_00355 [Sphingomonas sp. HITSZ_GF]|uniref:hypothetical protein n=1 Tax=Sphingomonas sp. HITSZ_GF TaxID=3037247 RepID=UPI00240E226D|nr:hypothetical protein [Sphingomonas sp. HITSZ_GF]MDG2532087.1 hypothetical protein [Sphingomonas sp. HITSZ_GF]
MIYTYVLSYNPIDARVTGTQLLTLIKESRRVLGWYSPFLGTYVLKSTEMTGPLSEMFRGLFDGSPFLLTHAIPTQMGGSLDPIIWNWINTGNVPALTGTVTKS